LVHILSTAAAPPEIHTLSLHDALPISVDGYPEYAVVDTAEVRARFLQRGEFDADVPHQPAVRGPRRPPVRRSRRLAVVHQQRLRDRKSTRLNSSHVAISYAVFCLKKKT